MANPLGNIELNEEMGETPWTIRHVEGHLISGPLSRSRACPPAYMGLGIGMLLLITSVAIYSALKTHGS